MTKCEKFCLFCLLDFIFVAILMGAEQEPLSILLAVVIFSFLGGGFIGTEG